MDLNGWIDVLMGGWVNGWMNWCTDCWIDEWMNEWVVDITVLVSDEWTDGRANSWMQVKAIERTEKKIKEKIRKNRMNGRMELKEFKTYSPKTSAKMKENFWILKNKLKQYSDQWEHEMKNDECSEDECWCRFELMPFDCFLSSDSIISLSRVCHLWSCESVASDADTTSIYC